MKSNSNGSLTIQSRAIGKTQSEAMDLGRLEAAGSGIGSATETAVLDIVETWCRTVEDGAANHATPQDALNHRFRFLPLRWKTYQYAIRSRDRLQSQMQRARQRGENLELPDDSPELRRFLNVFDRERDDGSFVGYMSYLDVIDKRILNLLSNLPTPTLNEAERQKHTYIVASTGYGKSELMKVLAHHYIARQSAAVVVIDPHRDMAQQIAQFPECANDRLTYIQAGLVKGYTVAFNPLDATGLSDEERGAAGSEIARTLGELVPRSPLTSNMEMLTRYCVRILMERPNSTLFDLLVMLGDKGSDDRKTLIEAARSHPNRQISYWFRNEFESDSLRPSKDGLRNRLSLLLENDAFAEMVCQPATFNIGAEVDRGGVLIFNLASLGDDDTKTAVGRLILAILAGIGQRRALRQGSFTPVHVFADEAQKLVGRSVITMLEEARKFGIHLTLAQQLEGRGFDSEDKKVLERVPAIHFVGSNDKGTISRLVGIDHRQIGGRLERHQFWCRWGQNADAVKLTVRSDLADWQHRMTESAWSHCVESMIRRGVYRPRNLARSTSSPSKPLLEFD